MKTVKFLGFAILGLTLAAPAVVIAQGPPPRPRPGYHSGNDWQRQSWARPSGRYSAVKQQGYRDGMYGAQKDVENGRRPTPNNRDEFRQPNVAPRDVRAYRDGFSEGYNVAMRHFQRGGYWR